MENNLVKNIKIYDDIIDEHQNINAWTDEDCFPIGQIKAEEKVTLSKISVIEVVFPGTHGIRSRSDELFKRFDSFLHQYISSIDVPVYLFKAEGMIKQKNRIRSYKGILPKGLNENDYIQIEFDLPDNYSTITSIIRIKPENIEILDLMFAHENSFAISSEENVFSKEFLSDIFEKHMKLRGTTVINYLSLCLQYCNNINSLYKIGGDGGDQEITFQIFSPKQQKVEIVNKIKRILNKEAF
jgi:hypothetical protein